MPPDSEIVIAMDANFNRRNMAEQINTIIEETGRLDLTVVRREPATKQPPAQAGGLA